MLIRGYNSLEAKSAGTQCDLPSYPDPTPSREEKGSGETSPTLLVGFCDYYCGLVSFKTFYTIQTHMFGHSSRGRNFTVLYCT